MSERAEVVRYSDEAARRFEAASLRNRARLVELGGDPSRHGSIERRDPQGATQTLGYQSPGQPMVPEWDAETAIRWAYYANVICFACVRITAWTLASLPFRAGKQRPRRLIEAGNFDENSPLARLLGPPPGGPAPKLTARRLMAWVIAQRIITGRYGVELELAAGPGSAPLRLWPLTSAYLRAFPTRQGMEWFDKFEYGNPSKPTKLRSDQVWYGWDPSMTDFREPESCLQAARLDLSVAVMMDRYNVGFLRNDARPAAVIVTEAFENDDEFRRFKSQWQGEHGGPDNANKLAFMEASENSPLGAEALKVHQLGLSQKDARFIEQHKASLERVAIAVGVPWSKLDASGRTFDNASEEDHNWWESRLLPMLNDLADEINMQIAPRVGNDVGWFDLSGVRALQPEMRFTKTGVDTLVLHRVAMVNEGREMVGLPPIEGGDRFLSDDEITVMLGKGGPAAPTVTPVAALPAAPAPTADPTKKAAAIPSLDERGRHTHLHEHADGTVHEHAHGHAADNLDHDHGDQVTHAHTHADPDRQSMQERVDLVLAELARINPERWGQVQAVPTIDPEERARRRREQWRSVDATTRTLEARWRAALQRLFRKQRAATLRRLEGKRGRQALAGETRAPSAESIFTVDFWRDETRDAASDLYEQVTAAGFMRMTAQFGISFDISSPYAKDFIDARANQLAGQVTDTTYQAIKDALAAGVAEGEGIPDLAQRIRDVFDEADGARSELIARTEVISAYNGSSTLAANELGKDIAAGQEWIATSDDRTRDAHDRADGQVVAVGDAFDVGGESLMYPGDPDGSPENVCNCRCTIGFLTPEEMDSRSRMVERRVRVDVAEAMLRMLSSGTSFDELAARRALRAGAA